MKRFLCLILSAVFLLGLMGCGEKPAESAVSVEEPKGPTWQEQFDLGLRFLSEGNYKEAILAFTVAIDIDPKRAEAYVERANAYIGSGETAENLTLALADYESARGLDTKLAAVYLGLADVYIRQGEYEKALEILKEGLAQTNDAALADRLAEVESGQYKDSSGKIRFKTEYDSYGTALRHFTYTYNDAGFLTETYWYNMAGNLEGYNIFVLNEAGKRTVTYLYGPDNTETCRWVYEYNEAGLEVRQELRYGDVLAYYWTSEYDDQNRIIRADGFEPDGRRGGWETWEYDAAGNISRHEQYNRDGRLNYYELYYYDADGNKTREETYDSRGNLISYTE